MYDSDSDTDEEIKNICYDSDGEYHEEWCPLNREDYMCSFENCEYVNLIWDNRFERIKQLYEERETNKKGIPPREIAYFMAEKGRLQMLKWFKDKIPFPDRILYSACTSGNLQLVKWLHSLGYEFTIGFYSPYPAAAAHGNVQLLEYIYKLGFGVNPDTGKINWALVDDDAGIKSMNYAIMTNNINCIKWLYEHDYPKDLIDYKWARTWRTKKEVIEFFETYMPDVVHNNT